MANLLSFSRIILALFFVYLIRQEMIIAGVFVLAVATTTDMLDGLAARKMGKVSDFGAALDPIADRFLIVCATIAVFVLYWQQPLFKIAAGLIISRELLVGLGFVFLNLKGIKLRVSKLGKASTALIFVSLVVIFVLPELGVYLLFVAIILYFATALDYVNIAWRKINEKA